MCVGALATVRGPQFREVHSTYKKVQNFAAVLLLLTNDFIAGGQVGPVLVPIQLLLLLQRCHKRGVDSHDLQTGRRHLPRAHPVQALLRHQSMHAPGKHKSQKEDRNSVLYNCLCRLTHSSISNFVFD